MRLFVALLRDAVLALCLSTILLAGIIWFLGQLP